MKSKPTLQVKRQPASGFRVLRAVTNKTRNRKKRVQRAATTVEPEDMGEIPGVGAARALVVILLLHVAAIAGIWIHNKWTSEEQAQLAANAEVAKTQIQPELIPGAEHYLVEDGDNYHKIAAKKGVSTSELKRINSEIELSPGIKINIPRNKSIAGAGATILPVNDDNFSNPDLSIHDAPITYVNRERPGIQLSDSNIIESPEPGVFVESKGAPPEVDQGILLVPRQRHSSSPEPVDHYRASSYREVQVQRPPEPKPVIPVGRTHTIQKGDTIWGLSKRYGVSRQELMRLNGITDAGKIRLGASLRIPGR